MYLLALFGIGLVLEEKGVLVDEGLEVGFGIGAVEEYLYDFVLEGEFGVVAVEVDGFVVVGVEEFVLALGLDEFLAAGEELSDALLPLSSVAHFVVLVHLLDDGLPVESLRVHPQDLEGLLEEGFLAVLLHALLALVDLLYLGGNGADRPVELRCQLPQHRLAENYTRVYQLLQDLGLLVAPPLALVLRVYGVGALAFDLHGVVGHF